MTKERAKELLPIITAFAEGKSIQFKNYYNDEWESDINLSFETLLEYRIKPEPREFWIVWCPTYNHYTFSTLKEAQEFEPASIFKDKTKQIIHVKEILQD